MKKESYYKKLFLIGAIWNFTAGLQFFFLHRQIFSILGIPPVQDALYIEFFAMSVLLFGLGYYWVSKDLTQNHDIVKLGIIGKILVFATTIFHYIFHDCTHIVLVLGGVGDLIFAVFFIKFLKDKNFQASA